VGNSKAEGRKLQKQQAKLMLRAFNGETEAAVARVSWNNVTKMEERIRKSFEAVNSLGTVMHVEITKPYLDLALAELRLTHEYEQKKQEVLEEQRRIKEQLREEELALREVARAQEEAEKEESRYEKALAKARAEMAKARGTELAELTARIQELQQSLTEAQKQKERAKSMAELTRSGHVYVISNVGSFGERVYKIGMTRRLNPLDRVKELGDASVPFEFDVHALIYTEDAPALERAFHQHFGDQRVNLMNQRKEFFEVSIDQIEEFVMHRGMAIQVTKLAEAREFRQTVAMREDRAGRAAAGGNQVPFPTTLMSAAEGSGAASGRSRSSRRERAGIDG
jgi:multidrug efflux pump subunit AcrA (membrane-fusion protein)